MLDEFDVNVDDESALEVAGTIMRARAACLRGSFAEVDALRARWEAVRGKRVAGVQVRADTSRGDGDEWESDDDDSSSDSEGGSSEDDDVDMKDAPPYADKLAREAEVDEDGFTKVTRRRRG